MGPSAVVWAPWYMISHPSGVSSGGGPSPIFPASHQAPSRASSSSVWSPQCTRSGEKEIHMWAPPRRGAGRWIIAHRPPKRRGKSAASLSSGGMTGPSRSTVRRSRVIASETRGPRRLNAVYAIAHSSRSGSHVRRGSSQPQISSG